MSSEGNNPYTPPNVNGGPEPIPLALSAVEKNWLWHAKLATCLLLPAVPALLLKWSSLPRYLSDEWLACAVMCISGSVVTGLSMGIYLQCKHGMALPVLKQLQALWTLAFLEALLGIVHWLFWGEA